MGTDHQDLFDNPASKLRYEAFSRLQAAAVGAQRTQRTQRVPPPLCTIPPHVALPLPHAEVESTGSRYSLTCARSWRARRLPSNRAAFGESCSLPIPEIVAIGGQSDGKSSLLEAFLGVRHTQSTTGLGQKQQARQLNGLTAWSSQRVQPGMAPPCAHAPSCHLPRPAHQFRFNVREVEMGTRRPLIVQMVHDPAAMQPRCRLQDEDSEEFGPVIPESAIADAIVKRTQDHLRQLGGASVSGKPIVMRAECVASRAGACHWQRGACSHCLAIAIASRVPSIRPNPAAVCSPSNRRRRSTPYAGTHTVPI
jgi:hypothetical protein